jgi:hypothetical protein
MFQRLVAVLLLFGLNLLTTTPVLADSPDLTAQSVPYQAGFPRHDTSNTLWFASPSVVDIDQNGFLDVLIADGGGCVWGWDHQGNLLPGFPWMTRGSCQYTPRINGPLAIADVDGNNQLEVVAGTEGIDERTGNRGKVFVWNANGSLLPGWPKEMAWNTDHGSGHPEVSSVALANITGDTKLEIVAGTSNNASDGGDSDIDASPNLYIWEANGSLLPGYPTWYRTAGIYGLIGAADVTGDGYAEAVVVRDHPFVHVNKSDGEYLTNWPAETYVDPTKTSSTDPRVEFTKNAPVTGDLDGDGSIEVIVAGKVKDRSGGVSVASGILVFNSNGQRRLGWTIARQGGTPLYDNFLPSQAPALGDLDADGTLEIVVTLSDGTIRAYHEDGQLMWQYDFAQGHRLFAGEPVIGDITGDGSLDVVFGTYSPDGLDKDYVGILGLDANGQPLPDFPLPLTHEGTRDQRGIRGAPTLADLDYDCDVEILAGSMSGTVYVWDLPARYSPHNIPWPTARHDNLRTGNMGYSNWLSSSSNTMPISTLDDSLPFRIFLPVITNCYRN